MRPAGKGPLESLYFRYREFAPSRAPELSGQAKRHRVLICGAGPIGLTAALTLARFGIPSVLLEKKTTFNDGSRAICIARASFHILEQIGAVEPFLAKALGWRRGRSFYRGREFFQFDMPHTENEKYLPMYNLQQQYIEQFLYEAAARQPLIDIRWGNEAAGVSQDDTGAEIAVQSEHGAYTLKADYVLAADGARSAIRQAMGLRLAGENYEGRYVIADVRMKHDYPTERRALFEPASNPGGTVLIHKQPENIWRIDYQLREGEDPDEAVREENIRARAGAIIAEIGHAGPWELEWWSIYTANTLALDDYRHGRVIFIGDAAHIVPIFGVRGLNNGLADAFNIGWKLGYALSGRAGEKLLGTYTPERRGATLDVFANAGKSARFMTPPTPGAALMRQAALSLALSQDFAREFANPRQMQPYTYRDTLTGIALKRSTEFSGGPEAGAASPNARLADGAFLLDRAGQGFCGICFTGSGAPEFPPALAATLRALDPRFEVIEVSAALPRPDPFRLFAAAPGSFYLLRPDLHIAARWTALDDGEVTAVLSETLGKEI